MRKVISAACRCPVWVGATCQICQRSHGEPMVGTFKMTSSAARVRSASCLAKDWLDKLDSTDLKTPLSRSGIAEFQMIPCQSTAIYPLQYPIYHPFGIFWSTVPYIFIYFQYTLYILIVSGCHGSTMLDIDPRSMIRGGFFIDAESYGEALLLCPQILVPTLLKVVRTP